MSYKNNKLLHPLGHLSKLIDHKFRTAALSWLCVLFILVSAEKAFSQIGYPLTALSGADGVFEVVIVDGDTVYRSVGSEGSYQPYMYFKTDVAIRCTTAYVEVTYKDIGWGLLGIHYNSTTSNYQDATFRRQNYVQNTHGKRTAVFVLEDADFRNAQNLGADLRLYTHVSLQMYIVSALVYLEPSPIYRLFDEDWISPYEGPEYIGDNLVDANTLIGKVICGYQGWFRAAGDPSGHGWVHYVHNDFNDLTVEMWPDMLEYTEEEKYAVPHWTHANGDQAYLFSSANKKTVIRHFQWMETYGIDGVAVQRFVVGLSLSHPRESFRIAGYAREAANRTGRTYFIMYDMSGYDTSKLIETVTDDWHYLVDSMKITEDDRYLHHNGKPVVGIFGFFVDRFSATIANNILDIFQSPGQYEAYVVGSGQWWWRSETTSEWPEVFRRMDAWFPWNVGNYSGDYASTGYWLDDKNEMASAGVLYMPLVYPGFGWDNLMNKPPGTTTKPRLKGDFLWQQFLDANDIGAEAVYVAMFDEIDEATAIFKVTNDIPVNHYFLTLEGLPSDFYLLMTGFGTSIINGTLEVPNDMPDFASQSQPPIPDILSPAYGDTVVGAVPIAWSAVQHVSGVNGYELEIDGQMTSETTTEKVVNLVEGLHTIRVRAINALNIKGGLSEAVVFTVLERLPSKVTFQCNMSVQILSGLFTPGTDTLVIRGGAPGTGVCVGTVDSLCWSGYYNLLADADGDSIYGIKLNFGTYRGNVEYKYVIKRPGADDRWEGIDNRIVTITDSSFTLDPVYFNNEEVVSIVGTVLFQVDMSVQENCGFFDPDTHRLTVRGDTPPLTWEYDNNLVMQEVLSQPSHYTITLDFIAERGAVIEYKYQFSKQPDDGASGGSWEEKPEGGNYTFVYDPDRSGQQTIPERYFGEIGPEDILAQDVDITWQVDVTPVYDAINTIGYWYFEGMAGDTVYSVDSVYIAGAILPLVWIWGFPGHTELKMYDDGTHGDITADDSIFSTTLTHTACSPACIVHKYGINGEDNEMGFAVNHVLCIPVGASTYLAPVATFGVQELGVEEVTEILPKTYMLSQSHPNPFHSSTTISFHMPKDERVNVTVYNLAGQPIKTLIDESLPAGFHTVNWDGKDNSEMAVAGGVYFYKLQSDNYTKMKKMILVR